MAGEDDEVTAADDATVVRVRRTADEAAEMTDDATVVRVRGEVETAADTADDATVVRVRRTADEAAEMTDDATVVRPIRAGGGADGRSGSTDEATHVSAGHAGPRNEPAQSRGGSTGEGRLPVIPIDPSSPLARDRYHIRSVPEPERAVRQNFSQAATRRRLDVPTSTSKRRARPRLIGMLCVMGLIVAGAVTAIVLIVL